LSNERPGFFSFLLGGLLPAARIPIMQMDERGETERVLGLSKKGEPKNESRKGKPKNGKGEPKRDSKKGDTEKMIAGTPRVLYHGYHC
jgi:hypothetical protein